MVISKEYLQLNFQCNFADILDAAINILLHYVHIKKFNISISRKKILEININYIKIQTIISNVNKTCRNIV